MVFAPMLFLALWRANGSVQLSCVVGRRVKGVNLNFGRLLATDVAASVMLLLLLVAARLVAGHVIKARTDAAPQLQRRWMTNVRNLLVLLAVIGLVLIWAPQLRTFALSLTAVAVAVVVATKELILCFSGSLMRASSRAFSVGDRIEVAGVRGEVVDHNIFVTTLHEFEPASGGFRYTGQTAVIPNSAFFGSPIRNDSLTRDYASHSFYVTVEPFADIARERPAIEDLVARHYAPFRAEAARVHASIERRFGLDLLDDLVQVRFRTSDIGKYRIGITLFCPRSAAEALENDITCDLLSFIHATSTKEAAA